VTPGYIGTNLPSTGTTPIGTVTKPVMVECGDGKTVACPNPDTFGYLINRQELLLDEPFQGNKRVSFGVVGFSANLKKPWDLKIYPRKYRTVTVISTNDSGRHFTHTEMSIEVNGKKQTIPVDNAELVESYPDSHFMFNPRLYLAIDGGVRVNPPVTGEGLASLQVSFFSHGKTVTDTTWTFLGLGAGYQFGNRGIGFVLSPVNYNVGKHLPLVDNMFIGPSAIVDTDGNVGIMGGLKVGL
jgi:hypothetical protein